MLKFLLFIVLTLAFSFSGANAKTLHISIGSLPPFTMKNNGKHEGILTDIIAETANRSGYKVTFKILPWARTILYLENGKTDAVMPMFHSAEREKIANFNEGGILEIKLVFYKRADSPLNIQTLDDAKGLRIARVNKANLGSSFQEMEKLNAFDIEEVRDSQTGLKLLEAQRVDLVASVERILEYNTLNLGLKGKVTLAGPPFDRRVAHIAFSKKTTTLETGHKINDQIKAMKKDGTVEKIISKYLN